MNDTHVKITMFGGFSMSMHGHSIGNDSSNSQKMWELLSYLITCKGREVSPNELIEVLWGNDELNNPVNALKTLVYRTRMALDKLGINAKSVLVSRRGSYIWEDSHLDCTIDVEVFEQYCKEAEKTADKQELVSAAREALTLYQGEFLSNLSDATWVMPRSVYYSNLLTRVVYHALDELQQQKEYEQILEMCTSALGVLPYDEPLNIRFIETLIQLGRGQLALTQYNKVSKLLRLQFGVDPSPEFKRLYNDIAKANDMPLPKAPHLPVKETTEHTGGALFCTSEVFDIICYYDSQTKARNGSIACLANLTITDMDVQPARLGQKAAALKDTIRSTLRTSDCFCQRGTKQFELLLQNATCEGAEIVLHRLLKRFHHDLPNLNCHIEYTIEQMKIPPSIDAPVRVNL